MSIYDKQISDLTFDDLQELLNEGAVENIRARSVSAISVDPRIIDGQS